MVFLKVKCIKCYNKIKAKTGGNYMKNKVMEGIRKYGLIEYGDNVLIGVSGGPDSMALFYVLMEICKEFPFSIYIAHVNHGVRGVEADEDEAFVKEEATKHNIPYYSRTIDMDGYARKHKISSEDAGRMLRYGFFREIISTLGSGKIAVAHNKNDQAETLLMRFMRGTGIDGLKGMEYINGDIIRPLLDVSRIEIEDYIKKNNIETRLDKTNLEPIYSRNKIRLELIPYIEENFNPNIVDTLWRTSNTAYIDSSFLQEYSHNKYKEVVKLESSDKVVLNRLKFLDVHEAIRFRIVRHCFENLPGGLRGITQTHISDVVELFNKGDTGKSIDLANNIVARISYEDLILKVRKDKEKVNYSYSLPIGGHTYFKDLNSTIETRILPIEKVQFNLKERFIKYFDYDKIVSALYIRNRLPGDMFNPFGMNGTKKLKDFFIDEKIPISLRNNVPMLVDNDNIIWIIGIRTSDRYKVTTNTKKVLMVRYIKNNEI